jgi:hypothetical protein
MGHPAFVAGVAKTMVGLRPDFLSAACRKSRSPVSLNSDPAGFSRRLLGDRGGWNGRVSLPMGTKTFEGFAILFGPRTLVRPGFPVRCTIQPPRVRLSLRKAACSSTTPRTLTGNPGERGAPVQDNKGCCTLRTCGGLQHLCCCAFSGHCCLRRQYPRSPHRSSYCPFAAALMGLIPA